jgi:hypothetical protein
VVADHREHAGDPLQTIVYRTAARCDDHETLSAQPGDQRFPATDLAVDGDTLYLLIPGTGIVSHRSRPSAPAS